MCMTDQLLEPVPHAPLHVARCLHAKESRQVTGPLEGRTVDNKNSETLHIKHHTQTV